MEFSLEMLLLGSFTLLFTYIRAIPDGQNYILDHSKITSTGPSSSKTIQAFEPRASVCYMTSKSGRDCNYSTCWSAEGSCVL